MRGLIVDGMPNETVKFWLIMDDVWKTTIEWILKAIRVKRPTFGNYGVSVDDLLNNDIPTPIEGIRRNGHPINALKRDIRFAKEDKNTEEKFVMMMEFLYCAIVVKENLGPDVNADDATRTAYVNESMIAMFKLFQRAVNEIDESFNKILLSKFRQMFPEIIVEYYNEPYLVCEALKNAYESCNDTVKKGLCNMFVEIISKKYRHHLCSPGFVDCLYRQICANRGDPVPPTLLCIIRVD